MVTLGCLFFVAKVIQPTRSYADLFDISQQAVSKALKNTTESSDSEEEVVIPDHLHGSNEKADFRKLSPEGQERVRKIKTPSLASCRAGGFR